MEFVQSAKKHGSLLSEVIYVVLNIGLAVAVFFSVYLFPDLPILAFLLVILSKWRVFAVRPRFWWENLQSNLLDTVFGISVVSLLWQSQDSLMIQLVIGVLYGLWLLLLKPRSDQSSALAQAVVVQFFAVSALFGVSYDFPLWFVVALMWTVGYIAARHVLSSFEETEVTMLSLIWGLFIAELGWLAYHWTIAYNLAIPFTSNSLLKVPQIAIIITLLSYFTITSYRVYAEKGKVSAKSLFWPALFAGGIILFILLFFNGTDPNG